MSTAHTGAWGGTYQGFCSVWDCSWQGPRHACSSNAAEAKLAAERDVQEHNAAKHPQRTREVVAWERPA